MSDYNFATYDRETKVWTGTIGSYKFPMDVFIGEQLLTALDKTPDRVIQINHEEKTELLCKDLKVSSIRVAQNLQKLGIQPDDIVGFICQNSHHVNALVYGCVLIGAVINPLHVSFTKDGIKQMFSQTKPKLVICDSKVYETTREALNELGNEAKIFTLLREIPGVSHVDELLATTGIESEFVPPKFDKPADKKLFGILCSSGTTGAPVFFFLMIASNSSQFFHSQKGVCMPHVLVLSFIDPSDSSVSAPISRSFSFSPIYWGSGLLSMVLSAFNYGETKIVTMKPFSVDLCAKLIEKYHPTSIQLNPAAMLPFLNSSYVNSLDFTGVKMFMCTGSIVSEELRRKFKSIFPEKPLVIFYGMTEVPISAMFPSSDYGGLKVGKIVSSIYLKVVDDEGNKLENGEKGEIRAKFEFGFAGYFNNPEETAEAIDEEGYFKTGDLGHLDDDGNIFVLGRNKDIFKYKGYHVREKLAFLKFSNLFNSLTGFPT